MIYDDWKTTPPDYFDDPDADCVEYDEIDKAYNPGPDCDEALTAWENGYGC